MTFKKGIEPKDAMGIGYSGHITKIVNAILEMSPNFWDNPNGPYTYTCPFCGEEAYTGGNEPSATMADIDHTKDCAYVIAKELNEIMNSNNG